MSPKAIEITLQTAVIGLMGVLVYIALTSPVNAVPQTKDSQTERYKSNLSKNTSDSIFSSNRKLLQMRITDPYSPYSSPYGHASVNSYDRSQAPSIIKKSR